MSASFDIPEASPNASQTGFGPRPSRRSGRRRSNGPAPADGHGDPREDDAGAADQRDGHRGAGARRGRERHDTEDDHHADRQPTVRATGTDHVARRSIERPIPAVAPLVAPAIHENGSISASR
jgi:hypothetical protein